MNGTPIAQQLRESIDTWDCIKLKIFGTAKETVTRLNKQSTEWKKNFASYTFDKGLKTRIYKVLKTTPPNKMIKCRNGQKN
jgi:hypothetical protein